MLQRINKMGGVSMLPSQNQASAFATPLPTHLSGLSDDDSIINEYAHNIPPPQAVCESLPRSRSISTVIVDANRRAARSVRSSHLPPCTSSTASTDHAAGEPVFPTANRSRLQQSTGYIPLVSKFINASRFISHRIVDGHACDGLSTAAHVASPAISSSFAQW